MALSEHTERVKTCGPRGTTVGTRLHRRSFDELPRLCNVLFGENAVGGSNPPLPVEHSPCGDDVRRGLVAKPSPTGLRPKISTRPDWGPEAAAWPDLRHAEKWSLALDLQILSAIRAAVTKGRGSSVMQQQTAADCLDTAQRWGDA